MWPWAFDRPAHQLKVMFRICRMSWQQDDIRRCSWVSVSGPSTRSSLSVCRTWEMSKREKHTLIFTAHRLKQGYFTQTLFKGHRDQTSYNPFSWCGNMLITKLRLYTDGLYDLPLTWIHIPCLKKSISGSMQLWITYTSHLICLNQNHNHRPEWMWVH